MAKKQTQKAQKAQKLAIYPGSFDPLTYGHVDVIRRAAKLFDRVIVAVAANNSSDKSSLFTTEERVALCEGEVACSNVEVKPMKGLLVDFLKVHDTNVVIRGMRAVSDFDYEFKMNMVNSRLAPGLETVFLMASEKYQFTSSSFVKEIARLGGDITSFVPKSVSVAVKKKLARVK